MRRGPRATRARKKVGLALVLLLAACGREAPSASPEAPVVFAEGWEFRVAEPAAPPDTLPAGDGTGETWRPVTELTVRGVGDGDLWLRNLLPGPDAERRLFFRAYTAAFAVYLDGEMIYTHRARDAGGGGSRALTYHVVDLPSGHAGDGLEVWVDRPLSSRPLSTPVLSGYPGFAHAFSAFVTGQFREDLDEIVVGFAVSIAGGGIILLYLVRRGRRDLLLLAFGLFSLLYGARLLASSSIPFLAGWAPIDASFLIAGISYLINVPAWVFWWKYVGRGWRSTILWALALFAVFAPLGIVSDQLRRQPMSLGTANNILVMVALVVLIANLVRSRRRLRGELRVVGAGLAVFGLLAINENLVGLGLLPWSWTREWIGFVAFLAGLGYVAVKRYLRNERELVALESELETARRIQSSILPQEMPRLAGLEVSARYLPMSSVAGDLYDFVEVDQRRLGMMVADVAGHGVPAALIASMVKVAFSSQRDHADDPARVVAEMNRTLCGTLRRDFVTAVYVFFDLTRGRLLACGAGHPHPLVLRAGGAGVEEVAAGGVLLGRFPDAAYSAVEVDLEPGDRVVLYTDGIIEALDADAEMFGEARLHESLARGSALTVGRFADSLVEEVRKWSGVRGKAAMTDDLTLVVAEVGSAVTGVGG